MGYIYRRPGRPVYMMKYYQNGLAIRESTGTDDEKRARRVLAAKETDRDRGLPVGPAVGKLRFEGAVNAIKADYANNGKKSWVHQARRIRLHLQPAFGGWRMAEIKVADITAYTNARREEGAQAGTVNRELDILRRMFTLAVQGELLLHAPHVPRLREKNVRSGFFEPAAFTSVQRHLPAPLRPVMTVAYVTGWRIDSEILTLEWRQVDLAAKEFRLDAQQTKNGMPRVFPMTADLTRLFSDRAAARDAALAAGHLCPWVFFRLIAKGRGGQTFPKPILKFQKAWKAACLAAGCPGRIPHDFRRTAIRNMVRRGVPERVAMQLTGHLTRSVFERYNIVSPGDLQDAAGRLEGIAPAETGTPAGTPARISAGAARRSSKLLKDFGGAARI